MNEKPLERLNYYNGQRLEANDLKLEQEYHIRVRRWLNKSLFLPGIAEGLEVRREVDDQGQSTNNVIVSPGLALDAEGREIILLEEERVPVMGKSSKIDGEVQDNYLTIQYREETVAEQQGGCTPQPNGHDKSGSRLAWGGPARLRAKPILGWSDILPHESSGKILLGQVELDGNCKVRRVHAGVRRYIGAASAATLRQYALEGERNIDGANPARIYFHIRGRQQNAVTLYLRAEKFSTLYYTEMGQHNHGLHVGQNLPTSDEKVDAQHPEKYKHRHALNLTTQTETTGGSPGHDHVFDGRLAPAPATDQLGDNREFGIAVSKTNSQSGHSVLSNIAEGRIYRGEHSHHIPEKNTELETISFPHTHTFSPTLTLDNAGVTDASLPPPALQAYSARSGDPLTYVDDLQVFVDGIDDTHNQTNNILRQLQNAQPAISWETIKLGNGTDNHAFVVDTQDPRVGGTGPIKIDYLPNVTLLEGDHFVELRVKNGGGRILYNLYVE